MQTCWLSGEAERKGEAISPVRQLKLEVHSATQGGALQLCGGREE
jgi:hypothetical protein